MPQFAETCKRCLRECCIDCVSIECNSDDIIRLAYGLDRSVQQIKQLYLDKVQGKHSYYYKLKQPCPFYRSNNKECMIQDYKPHKCWVYPFLIVEKVLWLPPDERGCLFLQENKDKYLTEDEARPLLNLRFHAMDKK